MCGTTRQALGLEMDAISSAVIGGTLLTGGVGNVFGLSLIHISRPGASARPRSFCAWAACDPPRWPLP